VAGAFIWIYDEDNDRWLPALANDEGVLRVEMSGTYSPDVVIITDGAGHYLELPSLTTAERNALTAVNGMVIYNSTTNTVDIYVGGFWLSIATHPHAAAHQNGGADEINVGGLSGVLADDQHGLDAEVQAMSINNLSEDATPQLGGNLDLNEKSIQYTAALDTDEKYSGEIISGTYGQDLVFGDLVYLSSDAAGKWKKAKADSHTTCCQLLGIALESGGLNDTRLVLLRGFIRDDDWDFTFEGTQLYVSPTTAGVITQVIPTTSGHIVRIPAYVISADSIYLNPDNVYIERA